MYIILFPFHFDGIQKALQAISNVAESLTNISVLGKTLKNLLFPSKQQGNATQKPLPPESLTLDNKPCGRFWQKFAEKQNVTIILSEYESNPTTELGSTEAIRKAINKHSVSMGNAKAMANLLIFFSKGDRFNLDPNVQGSETGELTGNNTKTKSNVILLGSQLSNKISKEKIQHLKEKKIIIPYEVRENTEKNIIEMYHIMDEKTTYRSTVDEKGNGTDYALIIKTQNPNGSDQGRELIILAGSYMYGVEAAAQMITEPDDLEDINKKMDKYNSDNIWLLIETKVRSFSPTKPDIIDDGSWDR